jgi:hypothetical protein
VRVWLGHADIAGQQDRIETFEFRMPTLHDLPVVPVDIRQQHQPVPIGEVSEAVRHPWHRPGVRLEPDGLEVGVVAIETDLAYELSVHPRQGPYVGDDLAARHEAVETHEGAVGLGAVPREPAVHDVVVERDDDAEQIEDKRRHITLGVPHRTPWS